MLNRKCLWYVLLLGLVFSAVGCATSKGSYSLIEPPKEGVQFTKYTNLSVALSCNDEVPLTESDKARILKLIEINMKKEGPTRFKSVNSATAQDNVLLATVNIKAYEKGNAFARAMLAGLGQMHIDAEIGLSDTQTNERLAAYEVNKRFAWGGLYGGVTRIEDIEDGFAQAVVDAILDKKD